VVLGGLKAEPLTTVVATEGYLCSVIVTIVRTAHIGNLLKADISSWVRKSLSYAT
jgi:hypothetical protein